MDRNGKSPGVKQSATTPRANNRSGNERNDSRRDTGRNARVEKTPEWMDFDINDSKTDFTLGGEMDDMEKFREQMKAEGMQNSSGAYSPDANHQMEEYIPENTKEKEASGTPKKAEVPVDQMFGGESKATPVTSGGGGRSRFAALFEEKEKSAPAVRPTAPPGITTIEQNLESATSQIQAMLSINPTQRPPGGNVHHNHHPSPTGNRPPPPQRQYPQSTPVEQHHHQQQAPSQQFRPPMAASSGYPQRPQQSPGQDGPDMQRIMSMLARVFKSYF
jgi:hypothetical protein